MNLKLCLVCQIFISIFNIYEAAVHQGCYKEDKRRRHFFILPGDFDPTAMTPPQCAAKCGKFNYNYCAVTQGKFCFCGNDLPQAVNKDNSGLGCSTVCSGDPTAKCGGGDYINVYTSSPSIIGLELTAAPTGVVKTGDPVNFVVSYTSAGSDLAFQMDYGDGAGRTDTNVTGMWDQTYIRPGQYQVTVSANDNAGSLVEKQATRTVMVDAPPENVTFECPDYMISHEEGTCKLSVHGGTNLEVTQKIDGASIMGTFHMADPAIFSAGPNIPTKGTNTISIVTSNIIVMPKSEFQQSGTILGIEYYAQMSGTIDVYILRPNCGGLSYCFEDNICAAVCSETFTKSCGTGLEFCPASERCWDSSTSTCGSVSSRYDGTQRTDLQIHATIPLTIPATGYNYQPLDLSQYDIKIQPGDILGFTSNGGKLKAVAAQSSDDTDVLTTDVTSLSNQFTMITSGRHLLRIDASTGSEVIFPLKFTTTGVKTIDVTVANSRIGISTSLSDTVNVLEGIDSCLIDIPLYIPTGEYIDLKLKPHTGSNVTYWWNLGNGDEFNTTNSVYTYQFTSPGTYQINITAFNALSSKYNFTTVGVQDEVKGLQLSAAYGIVGEVTPIQLIMTSGSNYVCSWSVNNVFIENTTDGTVPINSFYNYTFADDGTYQVSVVCSNLISLMTASKSIIAQRQIQGFKLEKKGALLNQPVTVSFTWTDGTSPEFELTFNGVVRSLTIDNFLRRGECLVMAAQTSPATFPMNLTASNLVSNVQIVQNFGIDSEIANASFSSDVVLGQGNIAIIAKDDTYSFSVSADGGTNVEVTWSYSDGSTTNVIDTITKTIWATGVTESRSKQFTSLGHHYITVTMSNAYSTESKSYTLIAIARVENLVLNLPPSGLFLPPCNVGLSFTQTSGLAPNEATAYITYGDGNVETLPFDISNTYPHTYRENGKFPVTVNVSNILSWQLLTSNIDVVEKIENMYITASPSHAPLNEPVEVRVQFDRAGTGSLLQLQWKQKSADAFSTAQNRVGTSPFGFDSMMYTYNAIGTYTITVQAQSTYETETATYVIECQRKVTANFDLISSHPQRFSDPSGDTVSYDITYKDQLPTSAYIQWDYGDGTTSGPSLLTNYISSSNQLHTFSHTYSNAGIYTTNFTIFNKVSSISYQVPSSVYEEIQGLGTNIRWKPFIPLNSPELQGYGPSTDIYPIDREVIFNMYRTKGTIEYYSVVASSNTNVIACNETDPDVFQLDFSKSLPGTYTVEVTALNPFYSQTISKTIKIHEPVKNIGISDNDTSASAYQWKRFYLYWELQGTESCFYVDYGDNTMGELYGNAITCGQWTGQPAIYKSNITGNNTEIQHEYIQMGTYTVSVYGYNSYSNQSASLLVVISDVDCTKPRLGIIDRKRNFYDPENKEKSSRIIIIGSTDINCVRTLDNEKIWTVYEMDPDTGENIRSIDLSSISSRQNAELALPPRYLDYGLYRAVYQVLMTPGEFSQNETYSAATDTFFKVTKSSIVAKLLSSSVTKIQRGYAQMITLQPELYSYDPDLSDGATQAFTNFTWFCRGITETYPDNGFKSKPYTTTELLSVVTDLGGCFKQGPGMIDTSSGTLSFDSANMKKNEIYEVKVIVQKGDRTSESILNIEVVDGNPPELSISCNHNLCIQGSDSQLIRPSARLSLTGTCSGCPSDTQFMYNVYEYDHSWPWKQILDLSNYSSGIYSTEIAIKSSLFQTKKSVTEYKVELIAILSSGQNASVDMILKINKAPENGNCTISPRSGIAMQDSFHISCTNWQDDEGIAEYRLYYTLLDSNEKRQITFGKDTEYDINLPMGAEYNGYNMNVEVKIIDRLGATATIDLGQVKVTRQDVTTVKNQLKNMLSETDNLDVTIACGDVRKVNELSSVLASLMNMASKNSYTVYTGTDIAITQTTTGLGPDYTNNTGRYDKSLTTDEKEKLYQEEREVNAQLTIQIVEGFKKLTLATPASVTLASSTLSELTQYPENCPRQCQTGVMEVMTRLVTSLDDLADEMTLEEIFTSVEGIVSTMSNILQAGNIHTQYPTLGDMDSVKDVAKFDTDLESMEKDTPKNIKSRDKAFEKLLVYTNEDFQAATTQSVTQSTDHAYDVIRAILSKRLVGGEPPVVMASTNVIVSFEKNTATKLCNKDISLGAGKFNMPDWCSMQPSPCDANKVVLVQSSYATYAPNSFAPQASTLLTQYSGAINIDLFDDSGNAINVNGASKYINIMVPLDSNMPVPKEERITPYIPERDNEYYYYHTTEIKSPASSIQARFQLDDINKQFLVLVKLGEIQDIYKDFDFLCMVPSSMSKKGEHGTEDTPDPYTCFISSKDVNGYQGQVSFAVREMADVEHDRYTLRSQVPTSYPAHSRKFSTNYTIQMSAASCAFYNDVSNAWDSSGCMVGDLTTKSHVHCQCNHMTTFSGGWVVVPNTIDWNFVFSNMDFYKNPTLYITEIVIILVFIITVIWARREDKRDVEKLGLTPLVDNDKKDKYYYEIVVVTGMRRNAGTDSKVLFILSGENDETEVRSFEDHKRKIFRRGGVDGFLMAVPKPLGQLSYLHVWHDNSGKGKFASWYLRSVVVRDVQTDQKYIFISNKWFAVEEEDGQIDRVIPVAGKEQMTEFSHLFSEKTSKSLSDGHLWFSVVARPPQSRFTRVQRVSCCLCLLYMSMLTNAMFYEQGDSDGQNAFTFGPFALSPEQIYIGVISNIIVFPVNFLIIALFRKSRPRKKRPSRIEEALKDTSKPATSITDVNPTLKAAPKDGVSTPELLGRPGTSMSRPQTSMSIQDFSQNEKKKTKKKMELPWYFIIFGWILLILATLVSAAFVTFYGIMFQDMKCKKWITSMLISFFTSVFVTQPIKVFMTAIFFSLVIKNPGGDDDEEADDEEKPKLAADEELLHQNQDVFGFTKPRRAAYKPPDPMLLQKAREVRMNEIKMWSVVREIVFYAFFVWILMVISYRNRSTSSFLYKQSLEQVFIVTNDTKHHFAKIKNMDDFWVWAKSGLITGIRAGVWYNDGQPLFLRGYINDKQSRIMGYATMRQLRIQKDSCKIPDEMVGIIHECNAEYEILKQEETNYAPEWEPYDSTAAAREEYTYTTSSALDGYPYWGALAIYSGGGYLVRLRGNTTVLYNKFQQLQDEGWIDRYTRAVFVEFTVYNPGINLFGVATLLLEFRPSQGIFPSYRFEPVMLLPYMNSAMLFQVACEIIYILFTLFFLIQLIRGVIRKKLHYFKEFWNLVEVSICSMSITAIVIYFYRLFETTKLTNRFKESHGNEYMKFQYVGYWSEIFSYIIGWLVFFSSLKFLKLMRFNKRMSLLASTLKSSCKDLMHFSIIFNIVFLAFIQLFYLVYVASIPSFKTFISSCESGIVMMMGKFDIYEMLNVEPYMTQIFIFFYVVTITFIVVNMFLSILNETFGAVRVDIAKQNNDYEIVDFMMNRFKIWTGLGTPDKDVLKPDDLTGLKSENGDGQLDHFPDRIDRLLDSISHMYIEKDRLDTLFERNCGKQRMKGLPPGLVPPPKSQRSQKYYDYLQNTMTAVHTNY